MNNRIGFSTKGLVSTALSGQKVSTEHIFRALYLADMEVPTIEIALFNSLSYKGLENYGRRICRTYLKTDDKVWQDTIGVAKKINAAGIIAKYGNVPESTKWRGIQKIVETAEDTDFLTKMSNEDYRFVLNLDDSFPRLDHAWLVTRRKKIEYITIDSFDEAHTELKRIGYSLKTIANTFYVPIVSRRKINDESEFKDEIQKLENLLK